MGKRNRELTRQLGSGAGNPHNAKNATLVMRDGSKRRLPAELLEGLFAAGKLKRIEDPAGVNLSTGK